MLKKPPKVSIIVINMNGTKYLNDCLSSVMNQKRPNYEVILVDNGSTDGSVEFVRTNFPSVKLVELHKNLGVGKASNIGLDESIGEYIFMLGNDMTIDPACIEEEVKIAESDKNIGCCQAKILKLSDSSIIDMVGFSINKIGRVHMIGHGERDLGQYDELKSIACAGSGAALYRRNALVEVGKWDDDFFYMHDDIDVGLRLRLLGWQCIYVPKAKAYHVGSATTSRLKTLSHYLFIRNYWYFMVKCAEPFALLIFFLEAPWKLFRQILAHLAKHDSKRLLLSLRANIDALKSLPELFAKRAQINFLAARKRSKSVSGC